MAKKCSTQPAITCSKLTIETTRTRFETCLNLTIKTLPERRYQRRSGSVTPYFIVSIVNFEQVNAGWERQLQKQQINPFQVSILYLYLQKIYGFLTFKGCIENRKLSEYLSICWTYSRFLMRTNQN